MKRQITPITAVALLCIATLIPLPSCNNGTTVREPYIFEEGTTPAWASFENPQAIKGEGAKTNKGAKGFPSKWILPGEKVTLMEDQGSGIINRIWMTISNRSPKMLRNIKLEMFWDGVETPAVSVPLGSFFCAPTGIKKAFQSALIQDPEGRSFISLIQMPYRKAAKITFTNESDEGVTLFYDINFNRYKKLPEKTLYFHTWYHHDPATTPGIDHTILPKIQGKGRFLGMNVGVIDSTGKYNGNWWGEGEVKIYIDGDTEHPSMVGTGTEDYIGTAWGQGTFSTPYSGCTVAGENGHWNFYRFHIPDPIYFNSSIHVTLQQIGGTYIKDFQKTLDCGGELIPISVENSETKEFYRLLELGITDPFTLGITDGWINFYRSDNVTSTAYFYYEKPAIQ